MDHLLDIAFSILIMLVEIMGAFIIASGVIRAIWHYVEQLFGQYHPLDISALRIQLGQSMVLALEFQVAADILKTTLSSTWEDLLRLGAIIVLRTVLNYLLEHELKTLEVSSPFPPPRA